MSALNGLAARRASNSWLVDRTIYDQGRGRQLANQIKARGRTRSNKPRSMSYRLSALAVQDLEEILG